MAEGDEFIDISKLGERTSVVDSDLMHVRSAGGIDSKISVTNYLKSVRDAIFGILTASTKLVTDNIEEKTTDNGVDIESVLMKDGKITAGNGRLPTSKFYGSSNIGALFTQFSPFLTIGEDVICFGSLLFAGSYFILFNMRQTDANTIRLEGQIPGTSSLAQIDLINGSGTGIQGILVI